MYKKSLAVIVCLFVIAFSGGIFACAEDNKSEDIPAETGNFNISYYIVPAILGAVTMIAKRYNDKNK